LADDINGLSNDKLQVPQLGTKIRNLRASIMPLLRNYITSLQDYFLWINDTISGSTLDGIGLTARDRVREVLAMCGGEKTYDTVNTALKQAVRFGDNAHRIVHSESILLYRIAHAFPDYRPTLVCTYLNMCQDCEQIVSIKLLLMSVL
jgi:hypothetical protein